MQPQAPSYDEGVVLLLVAVFLVVPFVELAVILQIGHEIGVLNTIGLLVLVSVLGGWLVKREGLGVLRRVQVSLDAGRLPGPELVDGAMVLVAGILLISPGFVTDIAGLLLLLPPTRATLRAVLVARLRRRVTLR
jgi:UPF0716 protein FxsA